MGPTSKFLSAVVLVLTRCLDVTGYLGNHGSQSISKHPQLRCDGTGYDLENAIFSPDGRNFQVEYAQKAVENGGTSIGIRCRDGVVLAVEKPVGSKLLKAGANKRIASVDRHVGVAFSGMAPDGRHFVARARDEADAWRDTFRSPIAVADLADRMGSYTHAYTLTMGVRPFGIAAIMAGWDCTDDDLDLDSVVGSGPSCGAGGRPSAAGDSSSAKSKPYRHGGPGLYMIEPSGLYWGYYGAAAGKGRQAAKAELEKLNLYEEKLPLRKAVLEAARILHIAHDDNKDKEFEIEMTWISSEDGPTKGLHMQVPKELRDEAEAYAKKNDDEDDDDDDKDDDKMDE